MDEVEERQGAGILLEFGLALFIFHPADGSLRIGVDGHVGQVHLLHQSQGMHDG